jgi:hypothetical protein
MTFDFVRILDDRSDTINVASVQYTKQPDSAFYMLPEHADSLLSDEKSGAVRGPDDYASPTSCPPGLIMSLIRGMTPGRLKTALLAASVSSAMQFP